MNYYDFKIYFIKMVPKRSRIEKGKSEKTPIEYNRAKFISVEAKLRFDKTTEIIKNYYRMRFGFRSETKLSF